MCYIHCLCMIALCIIEDTPWPLSRPKEAKQAFPSKHEKCAFFFLPLLAWFGHQPYSSTTHSCLASLCCCCCWNRWFKDDWIFVNMWAIELAIDPWDSARLAWGGRKSWWLASSSKGMFSWSTRVPMARVTFEMESKGTSKGAASPCKLTLYLFALKGTSWL